MSDRLPLPPFTPEIATQKTRMAEYAWIMCALERAVLAFTEDSWWRNWPEFLSGCRAIVDFLRKKWAKELDYRLVRDLWPFHKNRIWARFHYEWRDTSGQWYCSCSNEQQALDDTSVMWRREASISDVSIIKADRKFVWPKGPRRPDYLRLIKPGL